MNVKELKKLRKEMRQMSRKTGREYVDAYCKLPLVGKLRYCWFILTHKECVD